MDPSHHERQEEELQVLQAIYMSEFEDLRNEQQIQAGHPPIVCLKLTPLQSIVNKDVHAKVDLVVKYTTRYPVDPPILRLENPKGLSNEQIGTLKKDLDEQAKNLIGEVMVLQLAQSVQAFLHKYNVPTLSFHEQMLKNLQKEKEMQELERKKRIAKDEAQAKEFDDDVSKMVQAALQEREEALKEKGKRRQTLEENRAGSLESENGAPLGSSPPNSGRRRRNSDSFCEMEKPLERRRSISCTRVKQKVEVVDFSSKLGGKVVHCGRCIGHHFQGACTRDGLDLDSGCVVTACEWALKAKRGKKKPSLSFVGSSELEDISRQVQNMDQELLYLSSKLQHESLIRYHSMSIEEKNGTLYVRILMDNIDGFSIADCIKPPGLPVDTVKIYAKQLVQVINYLHGKSVVHRDLNPSNIFVCKWNILKVCGYAVLRRLSDLHNLLQEEGTSQDEFADYRKLVKPGKKGDIFNLGLVTLSLVQGKIATGYPVELPAGLPDDLQDFLLKCLVIDEKERWTALQLAKHPFLIIETTHKSHFINNGVGSNQAVAENDNDGGEENLLPMISELNIPSKTRLMTDFAILESLGQGGFGDVIKVRKKLDGLLYAIKRINLNPKSAQLKKRIIREVKLLSRLNHENVVRYYSSWIEAEDISKSEVASSDSRSRTESMQRKRAGNSVNEKAEKENTEDSLMKYNHFEEPAFVDARGDVDNSWADDENHFSEASDTESDSESDSESNSDDDGNGFQRKPKSPGGNASLFLQKKDDRTESSEGVVFAMDESIFLELGEPSDSEDDWNSDDLPTTETSEATSSEAVLAQYLYIQMEYCEKSTLRNVIDEGLHQSADRMWRLFREIVEGLSHVHSQGIIHRDLKPFNIFMDSRDHVKIGDFGLATSHPTAPVDYSSITLSLASDGRVSTDSSNRMTGKVGTALYVAPEIDNSGERVKITEKVDMYSLGVIFFEMCYRPLPTGMERVKTLGLLRTEKILLPDDFEEKPRPVEKKILNWLLNHDSDERPTASELLESGLVPPKLEDRHFDELLALTLKQPSSTRYKRLTAALFSQNPDPVTEQIYDLQFEKRQEAMLLASNAHEYVENALRALFTRHGAVNLDIPLLMPQNRVFEQQDWIANIMDSEGIILSLPFDSRVSLARYVSRNNIRNIKRYSINKVFRDTKISRTHPKEIKECSFDIISDSSNSMVPDAEVLFAVEEVIKYFPCLRQINFYARVNHTSLLKAILLQANVNEEQLSKLLTLLQSSKGDKDSMQKLKNFLTSENIPEHSIAKTLSMLDIEGPLKKVRESLHSVRKSRGLAGSLAKQAFSDLTALCKSAEMFGLQMQVQVQTRLAYNLNVFSGVVFQIVAEHKRKGKLGNVDILAAGGRYDNLLGTFKRSGEQKYVPHAVGASIAYEKIVNAILLDALESECVPPELSNCDVLVGVMGESIPAEEKLSLVRDLWGLGIRAMLSTYDADNNSTPEVLQDICKESGINHLVLLKSSDMDVRVRSREKDWFTEVKVPRQSICDFLQQKISGKSETKEVESIVSRVSSTQQLQLGDTQLMNITYILQDKSLKRKIESQVQSILSTVIHQSFLKTPVEVVVVDLQPIVMKNLFAHLEIDAEDDEFEASVSDIIDKQKLKKSALSIQRICSTLREIKKERNVVLLYGYKDDFYRIFI